MGSMPVIGQSQVKKMPSPTGKMLGLHLVNDVATSIV
jgi:hypothetical protein